MKTGKATKTIAKKPAKRSAAPKAAAARKAPVKAAKKTAKKPAKAKTAPKTASKTATKTLVARKPTAAKKVATKPMAKVVKLVSASPTKPALAKPAPAKPQAAPTPSQALLDLVVAQLEDAKAEDIVTMNLDGKSSLADTMVVASGRSNRHVGAIADQLVEKLKTNGYNDIRVEGLEQSDWVVVDTSDVIIHLFRPEVRSFYNLERLWSEHSPRETPTG